MNCLYCGDCCLRMSPLTNSEHEPCPKLVQEGTFYFCGDYEHRPEQCVNHRFYANHCPVGISKLDILSADGIRARIDNGWALIKSLERS